MQVGGFRESHDNGVGARAEYSCVTIVGQCNIFNFSHETLSMCGLLTVFPDLIRALAERAIGFLCEELRSFCPVEASGGSDDVLIWHECFPQFLQLDISGFGVICITFQVAPVSELLRLLLTCEFQEHGFLFFLKFFTIKERVLLLFKALQKS